MIRTRLLLGVLVVALGAAAPDAIASKASSPTRAQIRRAVRAAERSSALWATVNICSSARYPEAMGIRGQMPALGFRAELRMYFEVDYWDYGAGGGFRRLPGVAQRVSLGIVRRGAYQAGVRLKFNPHTSLVRGRVRFEWWRSGRKLGSVERTTQGGHGSARYSDPPGFSDLLCFIP